MVQNGSYNNFLNNRQEMILCELIQIDLNTLPSKKKKKKEFLDSVLKKRRNIFLKLNEENILQRKDIHQDSTNNKNMCEISTY